MAAVPKGVPAREVLAYLCGLISLASGIGLLWRRTAALAARVLLASLVLWFLVWRVRALFLAPWPRVLGAAIQFRRDNKMFIKDNVLVLYEHVVYELSLHTVAGRYETDKKRFEEIIASWRWTRQIE
jgi:hypothetical protein